MELRIDPEFRDKIPPLTEAEFAQLRENILADGEVREPLVVWNGVIVDGHNRWKIIQEHPEIPYKVREMEFADKWAAFEWIYKNQLGRRNLTDEQRTMLIGKRYEARKRTQGGTGANQHTVNKEQSGQNVRSATRREIKEGTAGEIGREYGMDSRSVRRAEKFAKGIDALKEIAPDAVEKVLQGKSRVTKTTISNVPHMEPAEKEAVVEQIMNPPEKKKPASKSNEGFSAAKRKTYDTIDQITDQLYGNGKEVEHTVDDLVEEVTLNGSNYASQLRNTLADKSFLLKDDASRDTVRAAVDEVIAAIMKVRDLI